MPNEITPGQAKAAIGTLGAGAIAALAMAVAALKPDEGKRNVSYRDIAGIPTSCYGHTGPDVRVGQYRTDAQCEALLKADAEKHLRGVLRCTPGLVDRPHQLAAATRLAFNIGVARYCASTTAARFNSGNYRGGCDAILRFDKVSYSRPQPGLACVPKKGGGWLCTVRGLKLRRERERAACLMGLGA